MKNVKRILALTGAILLILLYVSTLVFAIFDHSASKGLLKVSVAFTILLPVLLYAYIMFYRLAHRNDGVEDIEDIEEEE